MQITLEQVLRLMLAAFLSALIGYERSTKSRSAGLRTHALVGISSALVMIVSETLYMTYSALGAMPDPARLGAQIISGIGFLGAGTIIQGKGSVKGLTTAASVWSVAIIGIAVGTGNYLIATVATFMIYIILTWVTRLERDWVNKVSSKYLFIKTRSQNIEIFRDLALQCDVYMEDLQYMGSDSSNNETVHYVMLSVSPKQKSLDKYHLLIKRINSLEGVINIKVTGEYVEMGMF